MQNSVASAEDLKKSPSVKNISNKISPAKVANKDI